MFAALPIAISNTWNTPAVFRPFTLSSETIQMQKARTPELDTSLSAYSKASLYQELTSLIKETSIENWDGEGGRPIHPQAISHLLKLITFFPMKVKVPHLYTENDGAIGLDWEFSDGTSLVATIMINGEIAYSVYGKKEKTYGAIRWEGRTFPLQLLNVIKMYE